MVEAGTLCTNGDVEKKSGAFGNATADAETYTNVYIKMAEGKICVAARYDLVTNYASISTIAKEFLRDITSAYAAIMVIGYDFSGYKTEEAMSQVNILWAQYSEGVKQLNDEKFRDFLGISA